MGLAGCGVAYEFGHFLLTSPEMALIHPDQVQISGNHYVSARERARNFSRRTAAAAFCASRLMSAGGSSNRFPGLSMPPCAAPCRTIEVEITERTPIAFLREGSDLALVDVHGVILDGPVKGNFIFRWLPASARRCRSKIARQRMQLFAGFRSRSSPARPGAHGSGERSGSLGCTRPAGDAHGSASGAAVRPAARESPTWGRLRRAGAGAFWRQRL